MTDNNFDWEAKRIAEQRARLAYIHSVAPYAVRVRTRVRLPREVTRVVTGARLADQSPTAAVLRLALRRARRWFR